MTQAATMTELTPAFKAMTPLQKWETLVLSGLIGTDEPWIEDMRQALREQEAALQGSAALPSEASPFTGPTLSEAELDEVEHAMTGTAPVQDDDAESIARLFHETYERLAPQFSYETRKASAKPWDEVPENNRKLMIAVAGVVRDRLSLDARQLTNRIWDQLNTIDTAIGEGDTITTYQDLLAAIRICGCRPPLPNTRYRAD